MIDVGSLTAIATSLDGVRFRSRLEAKWSCLFSLVDLRWEYEPLDLGTPGDGTWIPDFALLPEGGSVRSVLVECKPILWPHAAAHHGEWPDDAPEARDALTKARDAGWRGHFAVLGATMGPIVCGLSSLGVAFGPLADGAEVDPARERPEPLCLSTADSADLAGGKFVLECVGGWGTWSGSRIPRSGARIDWPRVLWRWAGNQTQWSAR